MAADAGAPLRVGYVVKRFPRSSETFIAQELLELERRGVEVCVFALHPEDEPVRHAWLARLRAEVVRIPQSPLGETWEWLQKYAASDSRRQRGAQRALRWAFDSAKGRRDLGQAALLVREVRARKVTRLHAHFANRPACVALLAHGLSGLPFSFTAHAKDIYAEPASPAAWRRFARRAEFIATVSEANQRHLAEKLGPRLGAKVLRLYNGVDLEAIRPKPPDANGEPDVPLRILCVARLVPKKGLGTLLGAAALLRDRDIPFRCRIIGDGPEAAILRRQACALGLGGRVHFEGALSHERVANRLAEADLFALPCRVAEDGDQDALPTVLLEAMAAGLPCVSTRVGGIPEIIEDGRTGLLVAENDAAALADAIARLAADRELRIRMGGAGRRRAEERFDLRRNAAVLHRWLAR